MIILAILEVLVLVLDVLLSVLNVIPGITALNTAIQPYIDSLTTVINSGANLISFFVPMALIKVLIPMVITIEIIVENFDLLKFIFKKVLGR